MNKEEQVKLELVKLHHILVECSITIEQYHRIVDQVSNIVAVSMEWNSEEIINRVQSGLSYPGKERESE